MERRCLRSAAALMRLLGVLTPIAVRLLELPEMAQSAPETPATAVVSLELVRVVAALDQRPQCVLSANELWRTIARFGGYLNRKHDGPPGWKTLWRGWIYVQQVLEGVHLAAHIHSP